jgi:hypothetical protein
MIQTTVRFDLPLVSRNIRVLNPFQPRTATGANFQPVSNKCAPYVAGLPYHSGVGDWGDANLYFNSLLWASNALVTGQNLSGS